MGSYSAEDLRWSADRIVDWHRGGHDHVLAYFNDDGAGNAVRDARDLRSLLAAHGLPQLSRRAAGFGLPRNIFHGGGGVGAGREHCPVGYQRQGRTRGGRNRQDAI